MKKILILGLSVVLFTAAASAQLGPRERVQNHRVTEGFKNGQITRPEKFQLQKDELRYKKERRHSRRDGFVSPRERRKLHNMRRHNRHETFRFKHNRHHRLF
jgi:hypothetical protein